jgi:rare lipoprotein A (peptidoglycan hydrolase)
MRLRAPIALGLALAAAGCGASTRTVAQRPAARTTAASALPKAHPQVVEPVAGAGSGSATTTQASTGGSSLPLTDPVPTGPASNISAPAKGAPSDAEVQAALLRFHAAVSHYHLDRLNFSGVLLNFSKLPPGPYQVSIASVYTDYGKPIACGVNQVLHVPQLGVANKTLPCGTEVTFVYGHRAIRVPVLDRGPYIPGRKWDLTGATAEALHFPGLGPIAWRIG